MTRKACALTIMLALSAGCGSGGGDDLGGGNEVAVGSECMSSVQCDDGIPCTEDRCNRGWCSNTEIVCDDGDSCTKDACVNGSCVYQELAGCCENDADCDDGDPCTKGDYCNMSSRTCVIAAPVSPCCRTNADCDDGDVCTTDTCQTNLMCGHRWEITSYNTGVCCNAVADCMDKDACTLDSCEITNPTASPPQGRCRHSVRCCDRDSDCEGGASPCEAGKCSFEENPSAGECVTGWISGCCVTVADCPAVSCMAAACANLECSYSAIPGCCTADADCGNACLFCNKGDAATGLCERKGDAACCKQAVKFEDFATLDGFTVEPLDRDGYSSTPAWHISSRRANSGTTSLFFGDETTGYCRVDGHKTGGRAISPSIPLMMTKKPVLQFMMFKNTDDISSTYDQVSVYVISAAGEEQVFTTRGRTVFNSPSGQFASFPTEPVSLDKWSGQSIQLVFEYDSNSAQFVDYEGVYIEDVSVTGTCD